jgi:soluble lytic murein transglycosylase
MLLDAGSVGVAERATVAVDGASSRHVLDATWPLVPTVHPSVPREVSLLWLAPGSDHDVGRNPGLVRLASAVTLYRRGKYAEALSLLVGPMALDKPAADYATYYAARSQLKLGRIEAARRQFATLTARQPAGYLSEAAALGEAEAAEAAGDRLAAQRIYERLLLGSPTAPDHVWFRLARARLAAGDRSRAIEAFSHVHREFPLSPFTSEVASELSRLGALEPLAPANARYRLELRRADGLFAAKRYTEARAAIDRLRPHATGAERDLLDVRRAACDYFTRQYATARAALRPYRDRDVRHAEARFYDLMAARGLGLHEEFARLARDFVDAFRDTVWAQYVLDTLGTHFIQRNEDDAADAAFRQLLDASPTGRFAERASWKVGWRAYRVGRLAEAAQVFERAAVTFPRSDYRPAYLYWAARARESLGKYGLAASRYALVHTDYLHSYYGRLADGRSQQRPMPLRASFLPNVVASLEAAGETGPPLPPTAAIIRLLASAGLYDDARDEIRYAQHTWGQTPALQATLGWLSHQSGELLAGANAIKHAYPQYIAAGGDMLPSELLAVIFPMGYWSLIRQHAAAHHLDPYLLAALIAQESAFIPDIRSPANATGLMQLMPATARRYARKLALSYSATAVARPETNIRLGTAYFADLVREFGHVHLALASYNAGESRVRRWLAERADLPHDRIHRRHPVPRNTELCQKDSRRRRELPSRLWDCISDALRSRPRDSQSCVPQVRPGAGAIAPLGAGRVVRLEPREGETGTPGGNVEIRYHRIEHED